MFHHPCISRFNAPSGMDDEFHFRRRLRPRKDGPENESQNSNPSVCLHVTYKEINKMQLQNKLVLIGEDRLLLSGVRGTKGPFSTYDWIQRIEQKLPTLVLVDTTMEFSKTRGKGGYVLTGRTLSDPVQSSDRGTSEGQVSGLPCCAAVRATARVPSSGESKASL